MVTDRVSWIDADPAVEIVEGTLASVEKEVETAIARTARRR